MNRTLRLLSGLALTMAVGCSTAAEDACDEYCRCEACNDREYDECVIEVEAALDIADVYDCSQEAEELYECAIARGYCQDGDWRYHDVCAIEDDAVDWCVSRSSLLRGHYPNPGPD